MKFIEDFKEGTKFKVWDIVPCDMELMLPFVMVGKINGKICNEIISTAEEEINASLRTVMTRQDQLKEKKHVRKETLTKTEEREFISINNPLEFKNHHRRVCEIF